MTNSDSELDVVSTKNPLFAVSRPEFLWTTASSEDGLKAFARYHFKRWFTAPLLGLIWLYQRLISPALHFAGGPTSGCRFYPTCSDYAAEAIRSHGPWKGLFLAVRRLLRCTPLHPGGVDFVPSRSALRPRCDRVIPVRPTS